MPVKKSKTVKKVKKVVAKKTTRESGDLMLEMFDPKGKIVESVDLPKEIFGAKVNDKLVAQYVRVYLANQRNGSASTKTRGEVHGTTRKVWQQKGTGRARHGSRKAPIFVHGGIAFGPHPHDYSLSISKKMRKLALFSALSSKLKSGEIKGLDGFEKIAPKTKTMVETLAKIGVDGEKRNVLLVFPSAKEFENVRRASRNITGVNIADANMLNAYTVLNNKIMFLMKASIDSLKENFLKKTKN